MLKNQDITSVWQNRRTSLHSRTTCWRKATWVVHRELLSRVDLPSSFKHKGILFPKSLREYITLKLNSCTSYSHLKYEYLNFRRVCNFSYFMVNDEISLRMNDSQNEIKKDEMKWSIKTIWEANAKLKREEDHENYLLLLLISVS